MRILLLTKNKKNPYNIRLHYGFLMKLAGFAEVIPIDIVEDNRGPVLKSAIDLFYAYRPRIMIMHFHGEQLREYLKDVHCCKIMVAVDSHKWDADWYLGNGFDLVLSRIPPIPEKFGGIPVAWLPFSADEKEFKFDPIVERLPKVGFAGSWRSPVYEKRREILAKLAEAGLLEWRKSLLFGKYYADFLSSTVAGFTYTELNCPRAKMFELMASGTVVLSPSFKGKEELFGNEEVYMEYSINGFDVVEKAQEILSDENRAKEMAVKAYRMFLDKHSDSSRLYELYSHLRDMLEGRPIKKKWGF